MIIDGRPVYGPGVALPAANGQPLMPAITVAALVDDFEGADQRTALDTLRIDDFDGGQDRSVQLSQVVPDENGNHVLHVAAKMSTKASPSAGVVLPLSRGGVEPVDLTARRGIRFDVRGDGQAYELRLRGQQGQWRKTIAAGSEWQTVEVPFSTLEPVAQRNGNAGAGWSGDKLFDLRIGGERDAGQTLWLELDNVTFY
ncbi:Carbohydrate binding domain (family 11) [compost metagenome]